MSFSSQWRYNECHGTSNHRHVHCLPNRLFRRTSKKISKLPCEGNPLVTGGFPSQRASNAENVWIWWRHHVTKFSSLAAQEVVKMITSNTVKMTIFPFQLMGWRNIAWWRHQMETFSALLAICAGNSPVHGEFPAQRPVTRSFDVPLICARIYGWVNNHEAGDLRRHQSHYDVIVMKFTQSFPETCSITETGA